jgi:transposase-like protein
MAKSPYTPELREKIAMEYLAGVASSGVLANKYNIPSDKTVRTWAQKYEEQGMSAFVKRGGNARYTSEFKIMCVELCISGKMSVEQVAAKYKISSQQILRNWIMRYNANRELRDYCPKREVYMAEARRKTTIEERKEIVEYCIKHNLNYKEAAGIYDVSYSQVYSWVKKYDADGENALADKRGHHKSNDEVDELERLRRENMRLKRQLEEKEMLAELLKKVQEFERM